MEDITTSSQRSKSSINPIFSRSSGSPIAVSGSVITPFFTRTANQNLANIIEFLDEEKIKANPKKVLAINNAELKAAIISKFGIGAFFKALKRYVLEEAPSTYVLKTGERRTVTEEVFEVDLQDDFGMYNRPRLARFVKVFDPSKEEFVFLRVDPSDPTTMTVMGARASTFRIDEKDFVLLKET